MILLVIILLSITYRFLTPATNINIIYGKTAVVTIDIMNVRNER